MGELICIGPYDYYENSEGPVWRCHARNSKLERRIIELMDERISPWMYIRKQDEEEFFSILRSSYLDYLVKKKEDGVPTYMEEPTSRIYTKFPNETGKLRDMVEPLYTFNADIKYEKKVAQQLKLEQFMEIDFGSGYDFVKIDNIKHTESTFPVKFKICYFDLETRMSVSPRDVFDNIDKVEIITFAIYNNYSNTYTFYGWKSTWESSVKETEYEPAMKRVLEISKVANELKMKTEKGKKILEDLKDSLPDIRQFIGYPLKSKLLIKHFSSETEMLETFFNDFHIEDFDGIMTFYGRGGNIVSKFKSEHSREWRNGFDIPLLIMRAEYLGLSKQVQKLSNFPEWDKRNVLLKREGKKVEPFIRGVPIFDIYFDDTVLLYTKEEMMKDHTLNSYLKKFVGTQKIVHDDMVWELFEADEQKEMFYNIMDAEALFDLDVYFDYIMDVSLRALSFGGKIEDGVYASKLHDHINLWFASDVFCMDTRTNNRTDTFKGFLKKKYGGYNLDVEEMAFGYEKSKKACLLDFTGMYPSFNMSVNADLRTKVNFASYGEKDGLKTVIDTHGKEYFLKDLARSPAGFFRKDIESINTTIYRIFGEKRNRFKKLRNLAKKEGNMDKYKENEVKQKSFKGLTNGKYGADGMGKGGAFKPRNFDMVLYNTPPSMGQEVIKFLIEKCLPESGYKAEFASTDSAMIILQNTEINECLKEIENLVGVLNNKISAFVEEQYNPSHNYVSIGCDKVFDACLLFNKRMYVLNVIAEETADGLQPLKKPRVIYRGLEMIRGNSSQITTDVQIHLISMILNKKPKEEIREYLIKIYRTFKNKKWNYICQRASITSDVDEGDVGNQNYNACRNSNRYLRKSYTSGSRPFMGLFSVVPSWYYGVGVSELYRDEKKNIPLAFDSYDEARLKADGFKLDYELMFRLQVSDKINRFLQLVFKMDLDHFIQKEIDPMEY